jgi:thioesterase domain-containing protein
LQWPGASNLNLTVLRADPNTPRTADDLGWSRLVGQKVATFPIPGDHLSITVEAEAAVRIARVLQAAMTQAEAEDAK